MEYKVMVSICCLAYNHEKYIAYAIESFLLQKANFKYEIIIHDDASTDNTTDIIKEYAEKYPDIIKPIYQTDNKYSLGEKICDKYIFPKARGKYIALCESDDYWTDPSKLQIQVDYMEKNPDCAMCFHAADVINEEKKFIKVLKPYKKTKKCTTEEVILKKTNYPTASLLFPTELVKQLPDFYFKSPVGDVPLQLHLSSKGYAYYINKRMSAYRTGVDVSWTYRFNSGHIIKNQVNHYEKMKDMFLSFDQCTNFKYRQEIKEAIERRYLSILIATERFDEVRKSKYKSYFNELPLKNRILIVLSQKFPQTYKLLKSIKSK